MQCSRFIAAHAQREHRRGTRLPPCLARTCRVDLGGYEGRAEGTRQHEHRAEASGRTLEYGSCSRHASRMASETCGRRGDRQRGAPSLFKGHCDRQRASPASCAAPSADLYNFKNFDGPHTAPCHHAAAQRSWLLGSSKLLPCRPNTYLVADLVRMPLIDRLRGEEESLPRHCRWFNRDPRLSGDLTGSAGRKESLSPRHSMKC